MATFRILVILVGTIVLLLLLLLFLFLQSNNKSSNNNNNDNNNIKIYWNDDDSNNNLTNAFMKIQNKSVWPTPKSDPSFISSTFGPRIKRVYDDDNKEVISYRYDFHRGIDIIGNIGDPILASYDGIVVSVDEFDSGGKYITIKHTFYNNDVIIFHNEIITTWYTYYVHVHEQLVNVDDIVYTGDIIATIGKTGLTITPHLHHGVRIGTRCSLEHRLENPLNTCYSQYTFDPHIHPLLIYPHAKHDHIPTISIQQDMSTNQDLILLIQTLDHNPNVNRYVVQVINNDNDNDDNYDKTYRNKNDNEIIIPNNNNTIIIKQQHILDLNLRIGYNATTTDAIDTINKNVPYLDPIRFGSITTEWKINFVIPYIWVPSKPRSEYIIITITTIWGKSITLKYGQDRSW